MADYDGFHAGHHVAQHMAGHRRLTRRQLLLALLGAAAVVGLEAHVAAGEHTSPPLDSLGPRNSAPQGVPPTGGAAPNLASGPAPTTVDPRTTEGPPTTVDQPGPPEVIFGGDASLGTFALTFDDGTNPACAAQIVAAIRGSGLHATFSPNGYLGPTVWDAQAEEMAAMVATGQVSICNHTWDHKDLTKLSAGDIKTELLRNEEWIQESFGTSSRPFYRPPYGFHSARVDQIAGSIGFTKVILWNGTFGDSIVHPPAFILAQLKEYLQPGTIMLGHANHPATASVMDEIIDMIHESRLRPVTLLEMLGADPTPVHSTVGGGATTSTTQSSSSSTSTSPSTTTRRSTTSTTVHRAGSTTRRPPPSTTSTTAVHGVE